MSIRSIPRLMYLATCCHHGLVGSQWHRNFTDTMHRPRSTSLILSSHPNQARRQALEPTITPLSAPIPTTNPHPAPQPHSQRHLQVPSGKSTMTSALDCLLLRRQPVPAPNALLTAGNPRAALTIAAAQTRLTLRHPIPQAARHQHR